MHQGEPVACLINRDCRFEEFMITRSDGHRYYTGIADSVACQLILIRVRRDQVGSEPVRMMSRSGIENQTTSLKQLEQKEEINRNFNAQNKQCVKKKEGTESELRLK